MQPSLPILFPQLKSIGAFGAKLRAAKLTAQNVASKKHVFCREGSCRCFGANFGGRSPISSPDCCSERAVAGAAQELQSALLVLVLHL